MSSRKYNTNDNDLIWESFQQRTNHKMARQNSKYDELLENDLKYIEEFLIREGIWDKVKGAAGAAAGKVKDFAADKIMKPLMDMLAAAIQKDPASAEKLPELQQAAQEGGDIGAILQASGDQSIMKQIEGQPDAADPEAGAAPQAESYLYQFNMNSMICEALVDQGIISESKSQIIQERYYVGAIGTLFNEANKPKDCPWMPSTAQQVNESNTQAVINQIDAIARTGGARPDAIWPGMLKKNKGFQNFIARQTAAAATEAPTEESPGPEGAPEDGTEAPPGTPEAPETETVPFVSAANPGDPHPSLPNIVFVKAAPPPNPDGHGVFEPAEGFEWVDPDDTSAGAKPKDEVETPEEDAPQPMSAGDENTPTAETPTAETPGPEGSDPQSQIQDLQGQLKDDDPDTPDEIAQMKDQIAQLTAQLNGGAPAGAGPAAPTVGAGGASMPAEKPVADGATPAGGAPTPADGAKAPGILGKVWNFVKANKGAIGGLAAMGIAAALIAGGGPFAIPATRYLTGALMGGVRGAIKGAKGTEGGMMDKFKGAANQAGADSMKGGAVGIAAGMAGDAVGSVMGGAANAAADGQVPSAAAEPYVEPSAEPMDQTSDYGGNPEDYSAGGQYDMETPEIAGTSGGFNPDTGESNMDMSDEEAAKFNAQDANGETPGVDYQEPTAKSATEAEAGVGQIDPVTGKPIEMIDPENKPGFFKKLGSLFPGGTKPREVWGSNTGKG